jgi:hypothetical protein
MYLIEVPPRIHEFSFYTLRLNIKFMKLNLKNISLVLIREIRGEKFILISYFCELKI